MTGKLLWQKGLINEQQSPEPRNGAVKKGQAEESTGPLGGFWAGAWDLLCHLPALWPGLSPASCRLSSRAGTSVGADWFVGVTLAAGSAAQPSPAPTRHAGDPDRPSDLGEWNGGTAPPPPPALQGPAWSSAGPVLFS